MCGVASPLVSVETSALTAVDVSRWNPLLCLPNGTADPLLMVFLVYLLAFMPSWMICSSMLLRKWRKQEKKTLCGFQKANCRVLFHALDRLQARKKRALVHFLVGVIYFKKILPDFRFGRTYSLLMIVMLYQEYGNHGFGSQEEDFPSKAGQLFQGFSGRGIQAAWLKRECRGRNTSTTFSCDWFSLPFQRLQLFAVSFSCETTFFAQTSGRQDEAVR